MTTHPSAELEGFAVIGMSGRFPGARDLAAFWRNLRAGVESIHRFDAEELRAAGVEEEAWTDPAYVPALGVLEGVDRFEPSLFGLTPNEAAVMDPQLRLFLECAWEAFEDAGYGARDGLQRVAVFAGAAESGYAEHVKAHPELAQRIGELQATLLNERDLLAMQTAYRMDLRGVAAVVQSACSTSLLAVHLACQSLLTGECDLALAGGVAVSLPQDQGYWWEEGGVVSPDGHCRAFDAAAGGSLSGNGVGVVVLKRLADALEDGDPIRAVVLGSAAGNDGAARAGYTAPGVEGQQHTVAEALAVAQVEAATVGYVEAHGSGTPLGDPIEVAALNQAFGAGAGPGTCALGSVKTNLGHLDEAAGIAGLIKTVLALEHGEIPPSLHFEQPNPRIDFGAGPFYVNRELTPWPRPAGSARRAGVSSFGLGGTDVHVVLEEAPLPRPSESAEGPHLLVLSARTADSLAAAGEALEAHLVAHPDLSPADVAYTLQVGRQALPRRRARVWDGEVAGDEEPGRRLSPGSWLEGSTREPGELVFLFPGIGDQRPGQLRALYQREPVLRRELDRADQLLQPLLGVSITGLLFATGAAPENGLRDLLWRDPRLGEGQVDLGDLGRTAIAQPLIFAVELALAKLLMSWGLKPAAMIGYSVGELTAACLAGVFPEERALELVAARARLIEALPAGAMLAIPRPEEAVLPYLGGELSLAAANGPHLSVVAGPKEAVAELRRQLEEEGVQCLPLAAAHAFHSAMMAPAVEPLEALLREVPLRAPSIPFLSNVTGGWITDEEATDPAYWARHLRSTVRFSEGLEQLLTGPPRTFLEVGPGRTLSALVQQHPSRDDRHRVHPLLGVAPGPGEVQSLLEAVGRLWVDGHEVHWPAMHDGPRRRLRLPTYVFDRESFWIPAPADAPDRTEPATGTGTGAQLVGDDAFADEAREEARLPLEQWFWVPVWDASPPIPAADGEAVSSAARRWLVFAAEDRLGEDLVQQLATAGAEVSVVVPGDEYGSYPDDGMEGVHRYSLRPEVLEDYRSLLADLVAAGGPPQRIVHLWARGGDVTAPPGLESFDHWQRLGLGSLGRLGQVLGDLAARQGPEDLRLTVVADGLLPVTAQEAATPEKATLVGAARVLGREIPGLETALIDPGPVDAEKSRQLSRSVRQILAELASGSGDEEVAYRGRQRWTRGYRALELPGELSGEAPAEGRSELPIRRGGGYLITGGVAGVGLAHAEHFVRRGATRLVLTAPPDFPPREEWPQRMAEQHPLTPDLERLSALAQQAELWVEAMESWDGDSLETLVRASCRHLGRLDGVVHGVETARDGLLQLRPPDRLPGVYGAQGRGALALTLALERALEGEELDFLALCSSTGALVGGFGQLDLCATATFVAALAESLSAAGVAATAVEWGPFLWAVGEATAPRGGSELELSRRREIERYGISETETGEAFDRVLAADLPRIAVSPQHLLRQMRRARQVTAEALLGAAQDGESTSAPASLDRQTLSSPWVEPRSELETKLVELLQQLFGFSPIGVQDSFFELGGHSLLAIQAVTRMRDLCGVDLPMTVLFDHPTVEDLAGRILKEQLQGVEGEREQEVARLLEEIRGLSPEEVEQQLTESGGPDS
ncbi:MAG: beta-ketoacyl synthase N-terminal-like domain-containing protein [Acidobacteriota bacterium]|nr:beta-ketoacyl synthase N-terminal-like domain-containing protein [Acidobacteriota bacterium]